MKSHSKQTMCYRTLLLENTVDGSPLANFPPVCTNENVWGHAFCHVHKEDAIKKGIPTGLRDFRSYCDAKKNGKSTKKRA